MARYGQIEFLMSGLRDDNGEALVGGKVYATAAGTSTDKDTFQDPQGDAAETNPIILDAGGRANVFGNGSYKLRVYDADDSFIVEFDNLFYGEYETAAVLWGGTATNVGDDYSITAVPPITELATPQTVSWIPAADNSGASTLNVSGLGAIDIKDTGGNALSASDLQDGVISTVTYDGTNFVLSEASTVNGANIVAGTVDTAQLTADAVDGTKIADDSVDSEHIVDGSVDLAHMSANSVDSDQYVDGSIDLAHMSANSVDSDQYVDGSIDGVHLAADIVDGTKVADNAIDSEHITAGAIDLAHMSANSVDSDQYVDGSIDRVHLAADIVDGTKIADNAIDSEHITAGAVDLAHMSANSVDSDQYVDGSIDRVHLAADIVDGTKIADDAVGAEHIEALDDNIVFSTAFKGTASSSIAILVGGNLVTWASLTATKTVLNCGPGADVYSLPAATGYKELFVINASSGQTALVYVELGVGSSDSINQVSPNSTPFSIAPNKAAHFITWGTGAWIAVGG